MVICAMAIIASLLHLMKTGYYGTSRGRAIYVGQAYRPIIPMRR